MADVREEAARAAGEMAQAEWFVSHRPLIDQVDCQAAIICTTPDSHADIALDLLKKRHPCAVRKAPNDQCQGGRLLKEVADRERVLLTMASKYRHVDDIVRAKAIIASGILGDIIMLENSFTSHVNMSKRWNGQPEIGGGG